MRTLTLYTRPGCGLCDEMKAVIAEVARRVPLELREVDISTDPTLEQRYGTEIPVLHIDGVEAFRHRVTPRALLRRLSIAPVNGPPR